VKIIRWLRERISSKLEHFRLKNIKKILKEHGLALVIIIVGWEIVEDVVFPIIFALLGNYVHPSFYAGIPASLILCFHWLAVPILWGAWIRMSNKDKSSHDLQIDSCCDSHDH